MKILNVKLMVIIFILQMTFAHSTMAGLIGPDNWNGDNIDGFLGDDVFSGIETSVTLLDFNGQWIYTAIGRESGHKNDIDKTVSAGLLGADTLLTFSTSNDSNWGVWDTVDFNKENLFFEDSDGPWNVGLDSFGVDNIDGFKLFRLTENTTLTYLAGNTSLSLFVGDIIVGFNDNHSNKSDRDYDDIIIAMRATDVPAPATLALFGLAIVGLVFTRRKTA